jgi:uncharacterized membrane protein
MTTGGWIFMLVTWAVILLLVIFTYYRTIFYREECDDSEDP